MQTDFWLNRWQEEKIGFHLNDVHPLLKKFHAQVFSENKAGVFVPLCGKSKDLKFLAELGYLTLGCELSEIAANAFFVEQNLSVDIKQENNFKSFNSHNIQILQGDYFKLTTAQLSQYNTIYDRAALIAMPEAMRQDYVDKMHALFFQAKLLLITLEYPKNELQGPPFSVVEQDVKQLFDFAKIEKIYTQNILSKEPRFVEKGVSQLNETAYFIQW